MTFTPYQNFIFTRTYSRYRDDLGRRETWEETISRYGEFFAPRVPAHLQDEWAKACNHVEALDIMPSMRALWTAGEALDRDNIAGYNCAFLAIDTVESFSEILHVLMNGTGVGISVEREFIRKLPTVPDVLLPTDSVIVFEDSKEGWAKGYNELLQALYAGEIPAYDLSQIRPKGARLKTFGGRASGPEPLLQLIKFTIAVFQNATGRRLHSVECFDLACNIANSVVVGGVRRSALLVLSDFSDDRMRTAKIGEFWRTNPHRALANISVSYTEKPDAASFLREFESLIRSESGERGIFNRVSAQSIARAIGRKNPELVLGCNPCCFTGDMKLLTSDGYRRFDELAGSEVEIVNHLGGVSKGKVWSSGEKEIVKVKIAGGRGVPGRSIFCTADHVFMLNTGEECRADALQGKRLMPHVLYHEIESRKDFLAGFILGDGALTRLGSDEHLGLEVFLGKKDGDVARFLGAPDAPSVWYSREARDVAIRWGLFSSKTHERELPADANEDFMSGLWTANGSVIKSGRRMALKTTSKLLADGVRQWLEDRGVSAYITTNKPHPVKFGNGTYDCRESYDVNVSGGKNAAKFASVVRFVQEYKHDAMSDLILANAPYVQGVRPRGTAEVFDFSEPETHWGVVEGVVVHNSEILLRSREFCNLSSVVVRRGDSLEVLRDKVRHATILGIMQSTLTDFRFIGPEWKKNCEEERLLGVSLNGLRDHEVLGHAGLGAERWLEEMRKVARQTAEEWATALGIAVPKAITCVKPEGTTAQLVDCASGLHPRFAPYYIRRVRVSATDPLCRLMIDSGVPHEPEVGYTRENAPTWVFSFPQKAPEGSVYTSDVSAIEQLGYWLMLQKHWCDHKPSITVYVKPDEWPTVAAWVYEHWEYMSGVSFLPADNGVYQLAPYEAITPEVYQTLTDSEVSLDFSGLSKYESSDQTTGSRELNCSAGSCELV